MITNETGENKNTSSLTYYIHTTIPGRLSCSEQEPLNKAVKWLREGGAPRRLLLQRFHATKTLVSATAMPDCKPHRLLVLNLI